MAKRLSVLSSALFLSLIVAIPAVLHAQTGLDTSSIVDTSRIRIDNFARVAATYYRGAAPEPADYASLAALDIKTLVDLRSDDIDSAEQTLAAAVGMKYVNIPMTTHETPSSAKLDQFLSVVNDPSNQPVYVHCAGGRHRTGVMTAAYRMTHDGWTPDRAFKEMKAHKYGPDFLHPEFKAFVYAFRAPAPAPAVKTAEVAEVAER
jgi:protein tyrosine/serine phosphatase